VCFVLDTSGSMQADGKLQKAKDALKFCIASLRDKDRFNVIAFSTATDAMSKTLMPADAANKALATAFIDKQEPIGGTAIHQALGEAVAMMRGDAGRTATVVFLTDGRPTIGEDREDEIVKVAGGPDKNVRVFTWGVGSDVNTRLLDLIAQKTRAVSEYVAGDENIEQKVSLFFNKMAKPVLAAAAIDWGKLKVHDVYPKELGDLFAGQQVTVFGRYEGSGDAALTLEGTVNGRKVTQVFEATFGKEAGNPFVEKLWAARHVGFLLDEVRLRGEKPELKDEIIRLSRTYGIQTPYTSYLVLETKDDYARHGLAYAGTAPAGGGGGDHLAGTRPAPSEPSVNLESVRARMDADGVAGGATGPSAPADSRVTERWKAEGGKDLADRSKVKESEMREVTGEAAVRVAKAVGDLKKGATERAAGQNEDGVRRSLVRRVGERSFYWYAGFYVDGNYTDKLPTIRVKYLSDAYFKLLEKHPSLKDVYALGDRLIVVLNGTSLVVDDGGKEQLAEEEMRPLGTE
jgi:Ca-activated chloride channel family protein